ncbi:hypothetical protein BDV95DRAFT_591379 [Massariosphaeria phaeospora]|uniref:BZIP domain-containing protein n=1 Tax=Massariosphaeria phaeospora TaxID=100035 RepID=A0A7C8MGF9_9PLEO|nr:hypothetical protein BDV95DRAFT_591379 [Massariosphaeria phaeospora]
MSSPTSSTTSESLPARRKPRVSAEHTLNRVRENQRRHRARRKDYITSLEEQIQDMESQLAEARAEIEKLKAEREDGGAVIVFRCAEDAGVSAHGRSIEAGTTGGLEEERTEEDGGVFTQHGAAFMPVAEPLEQPNNPHPAFAHPMQHSSTFPIPLLATPSPSPSSPHPSDPVSPTAGPPPCCSDAEVDADSASPLPPPIVPSDPQCSTCATRPPPAPSESTTLCSQAYVMISQQNVRNIDAATIRLWLWQGYRRAQRRGEGCRVENGVLMSLLDFISGV